MQADRPCHKTSGGGSLPSFHPVPLIGFNIGYVGRGRESSNLSCLLFARVPFIWILDMLPVGSRLSVI